MTRSSVVALALALISVSCAPAAAPETTTTTIGVTTVTEPTTTSATADDSPIDLCAGFVIWDADTVYATTCFAAPLTLVPSSDGWRTTRVNVDVIEGHWTEPGERQPSLRFVFLSHQHNLTPAEAIDALLSIEGVEPLSTPAPAAGAISVDVASGPDPTSNREEECMVSFSWAIDLTRGDPGITIIDHRSTAGTFGRLYGLGACHEFRVWAIPTGGGTITVIATVNDLDRFDELMPMMDELVASVSAATP